MEFVYSTVHSIQRVKIKRHYRRRCRRAAVQRPLPPARPTSAAVRFQPHWHQHHHEHHPSDDFQQQRQHFFPHMLSATQGSRAPSVPSLAAYSSAEDGETEKNVAGAARSEETALSSPAPDTPPPFDNDALLPPQLPFGTLKSKRSDDGTSESGSLNSSAHNVNIAINQNYPPFPASTHTLSSVTEYTSGFGLEGTSTPTTPTLAQISSQPTTPARSRASSNNYTANTRQQRSRPLSTAYSVASSMSGSTSFAHTPSSTGRRGAPHSRHSRVEIILPTPLAPPGLGSGYGGAGTGATSPYLATMVEASPSSRRASLPVLPRDTSRLSMCDPWLSAGRNASAASGIYGNGAETPARQRRSSRGPDGERSCKYPFFSL